MASAIKTTRGFATRCPECGEENTLRIDVADVHSLSCSSCDAELTAADLRHIVAGWTKLLVWLDTAPVVAEHRE
jgi:uncharacterized protein (DUF983 family)